MKRQRARWFVLGLVALAAGAASLLDAGPAAAEKRLFRVQRRGFGAPFPRAVALTPTPTQSGTMTMMLTPTTMNKANQVVKYGGAGRYEYPIEPHYGLASTAIVAAGNPPGGKFTLPKAFIDLQDTFKLYSNTAFKGYTSFSYVTYINGRGRFKANNPYAATTTISMPTAHVVFPTTLGNPLKNKGTGYPDLDGNGLNDTPGTTTFDFDADGFGDFDFLRAGSIDINPGPNRFGGTMRFLYDTDTSEFYQYIKFNAPLFFKAYGTFNCLYKPVRTTLAGMILNGTCTEDFDTKVGQITSTGMVNRFLLNTTTTTMLTYMGQMSKTYMNHPSKVTPYIASKAYYLHLIAPWTTGTVGVYNIDSMYNKTVQSLETMGGDMTQAAADTTLTRTTTVAQYNMGGMTVGYKYYTTTEKLEGVTRVVSLVRPRLNQAYLLPRIPSDPIDNQFSAARMWTMKVYFMPEPGALLLLGSGIAGLAGLYLLRRR